MAAHVYCIVYTSLCESACVYCMPGMHVFVYYTRMNGMHMYVLCSALDVRVIFNNAIVVGANNTRTISLTGIFIIIVFLLCWPDVALYGV